MILFVTFCLLKLATIWAAIKYKLKFVWIYLAGNLFVDIAAQVFKLFQHYPKPYTGIGFYLFAGTTFCYLFNAAWMMFCAGKSLENKTLQQGSILGFVSIYTFILYVYPAIAGVAMLHVFYAFCAAMSLITFLTISSNIFKITVNQTALLMLSLGELIEVLLLFICGYQYYWLVNLCNGIFYSVTLIVSLLLPRYERLLRR